MLSLPVGAQIEARDVSHLTEQEFQTMYQIERDTWAHFMGEYVVCRDCETMFSKADIYSEADEAYIEKTVGELESKFGRKNVTCKCCGGETDDIRGEDFISTLEQRIFGTKQAFVNLCRSKAGEILGFSYGFIDSPEQTYEKEFRYHFTKKLQDEFEVRFGNTDLLTLSGVCFRQSHINVTSIYELLKYFYCAIPDEHRDLISIGEAIANTPSYTIYKKMGGVSIDMDPTYIRSGNTGGSEIIFYEKIVRDCREIADMGLREFLRYSRKRVENIA